MWAVVAYVFNRSTQEAETGEFETWCTERVPGPAPNPCLEK